MNLFANLHNPISRLNKYAFNMYIYKIYNIMKPPS